jgi:hypothetical protein
VPHFPYMRNERKRYPVPTVATAIVLSLTALFLFFFVCVPWYQARRPSHLPANSIWIDAPHVPLGFNRGWWQGCWVSVSSRNIHCELWGAGGLGTVYAGEYVPCDGLALPLPADLVLKEPRDLWAASQIARKRLLPVVLLRNGRFMGPTEAPDTCVEIYRRMNKTP